MHYLITSHCTAPGGQELALAVNHNPGQDPVIVLWADPTDDHQLWTPIAYVRSGEGPQGIAFVNAGTGEALAAPEDNSGAVMVALDEIDDRSTWTFGEDDWAIEEHALRPYGSDTMNLNLFGGGPYNPGNPVGVWDWGDGQPNELWKFTLVDTDAV